MIDNKIYQAKINAEQAYLAIFDLKLFVKLSWPIIEPGSPFVEGWHIDAICEHLQAVSSGLIKDLLINVPPRHGKSSVVSVCWPVWEWIKNPSCKWLFSSYAQSLSTRDSLKSRRLIQSKWFQKYYGDCFKLLRDQNKKMRYDNDKAGYRIATSVTGSNTGEGGDRIVCLPYDSKITLKYSSLSIGLIVENKMPLQVLSYNKFRKKLELKFISNYFMTESNELISVTTNNKKNLKCTPNHLVFTSNRGYIKAIHLTRLDFLLDDSNNVTPISEIEHIKGSVKTYNIEVKDNNNYFANGLLVHNCDDGNNAAEGESQAVLESTGIWWREVMSTRKNDPMKSTRTVIAQRLSDKDISGIILENGNYEHLCLPAEYEGSKKVTSLGWSDPRKEIGELLWPNRFNREALNNLKKELGSYGTSGQLQQRPTPREGGIIKISWFQYYKLTRDVHFRLIKPKFNFIFQSWDTAFKDGEQNDFSVCQTFGLMENGFYLINRWQGRVDFPELEKKSIELANIYSPNQILIEDKASGQSLIQSLQKRTRLPIKAIKVDRDKIARMYAVSPIIESGRYFLPEGEPWLSDYIDAMVKFPGATHDDDVDATTQALMQYGFKQQEPLNNHRTIMGR